MWLGLGVRAVRLLVLALQAASVAVLAAAGRRLLSPRAAWIAALCWTAYLVVVDDVTTLWNPSPAALPLVLYTVAAIGLSRRGSLIDALLAGFWAGLLLNVHVGFAVLLPPTMVLAVAATRRPWLGLPLSLAAAASTVVLASRAMLRIDALALARHPGVAGVGLAGLVAASVVLRFAWHRFDQNRRQGAAAVAVLASSTAGLLGFVLQTRGVIARAMLPGLPALSLAIGWLAARLLPRAEPSTRGATIRIALSALVLVLAIVLRPAASPTADWSYTDMAAIAPAVLANTTWGHLFLGLEGPRCWDVTAALAPYAPAPARPEEGTEPLALRLLRIPDTSSAVLHDKGGTVVPLESGWSAVFQRTASRLRWSEATVCIISEAGRNCAKVTGALSEQFGDGEFLFGRRAYPQVHDLGRVEPYRVEFQVPVSPWPRGGEWVLDVLNDGSSSCGWEISRTTLEHDGSLPTESLRVADPSLEGMVVLSRRFDGSHCGPAVDQAYPPCVFESGAGELEWRRAAAGRTGR